MASRVLITGGAGFIGCSLASKLLARGDEVVVFDNLHPQVHTGRGLPVRMPKAARFVPGDVTVASNWQTLLRFFLPDIVVHLAAETGTGQSLTEANRHASVNVGGTATMLDAFTAAKHVPGRFVLTSSRAVYGDGAWQEAGGKVFYPAGRARAAMESKRWDPEGPTGLPSRPLPHDAGVTQPNPISVYGATKLAQEHILSAWSRAFGSVLSVLRLQNVFGPGQALGNPYTGVLTFFSTQARAKNRLDVYEDGAIIRDFVHVEDVTDAMVASLSAPKSGLWDIGSGAPVTIHEVARIIARRFQAPEPQVTGRFRDGDVRAAFCSIEAARRDLGWTPRVSLEAGLESLAASVENS